MQIAVVAPRAVNAAKGVISRRIVAGKSLFVMATLIQLCYFNAISPVSFRFIQGFIGLLQQYFVIVANRANGAYPCAGG